MPRITASRLLLVLFIVLFATVLYLYYQLPTNEQHSEESDEYYDVFTERTLGRTFEDTSIAFNSRLEFRKIDEQTYAISAYTDDRNGNMGYKFIRVLMVIASKEDYECEINGVQSEKVSLYEFSENHGRKMQFFILNCELPTHEVFENVQKIKVIRKSTRGSVEVPIIYRIHDEKSITPDEYDLRMTICIPTLFGDVYNARRIVEFVELNKLQGIEKIFIYRNAKEVKDAKLRNVLDYYSNSNIVQLIDYEIPFYTDDIWYHGQLITITDCLLRNTGFSKFTFFHDIDEFFVPVLPGLSLYESVSIIFKDPEIGSQRTGLKYISTKINEPPITLNNILSSKPMETRFTKCVVRPEMVFEQGIHHTSRVIQDNYKTASNDGSIVRIYHYKEPTYCCEDESILKRTYGVALRKQFDLTVGLLSL